MNISVIWRNPQTGKDYKTESTTNACILEVYVDGREVLRWRSPDEAAKP